MSQVFDMDAGNSTDDLAKMVDTLTEVTLLVALVVQTNPIVCTCAVCVWTAVDVFVTKRSPNLHSRSSCLMFDF